MNESDNKIITFNEIDGAPKAVGPYSPAVRVGNTYYLSGQVGLDPATGKLIGADIETQTRQVFKNLSSVLKGLGLSFNSVAKSTVFLTDMANFQTLNALYAEAMGTHKPARSTIQVSALPMGALIEIELIAVG
jgi:2-iminobutanoate/2-iminopropanoate deaminase